MRPLGLLPAHHHHRSIPDGTQALSGNGDRPLSRRGDARAQALVEFAIVIGLFMLVIGGIVQFGIILWSQNAITQISRDTARYAVTLSDSPCDQASTRDKVRAAANNLARGASLVSYAPNLWASASSIGTLGAEGIGVDWPIPAPQPGEPAWVASDCPPSDNSLAWTVHVRINHVVPIFIPGLRFIAPPCAGNGFCLSSETELRMEPKKP
jgi:hypothetical protein